MRALFFMVCLVACKTSHTLDASLVSTDDKEKTTAVGPSAKLKFAPIVGKPANADKPDGLPPHGDLLSATLHAGSLETLRELSRKQEKINSTDKFSFLSLWPLLAAALPIAGGALLFKLKPAWISWVWSALKALFGKKT